ncbi:MAG TPA: LytTR family transcriptional regulator, partial [Bacteroidetes bacterium]|nr:LytTR family transcriptional regulator [Bacteroidota bacterium]
KLTGIYFVNRKRMVSSYSIGKFRKLLDNHNFFSPHKSHLINMNHVKKYLREGVIEMIDGSSVPVAKRKKSEFLEIMKNMG